MFGIGPTELLIIGLLALVIFGPAKLSSMARDFGRFVSGSQDTFEEIKSEFTSARHEAEKFKSELVSSGKTLNEPASDPHPGVENGEVRERRRKLPQEE